MEGKIIFKIFRKESRNLNNNVRDSTKIGIVVS